MDDRARLSTGDLSVLGVYLYGERWQSALGRAVHRSARQIRRWVAEAQPVSFKASALIEALVCRKHIASMRRLHTGYLNMVDILSDSGIKGRLLAMDNLVELNVEDQLRRAAMAPVEPPALPQLGGVVSISFDSVRYEQPELLEVPSIGFQSLEARPAYHP